MAHGAGGTVMQELIERVIVKILGGSNAEVPLEALDDAAIMDGIVLKSDSHTVKPLFFPGGDIGRLAIAGTRGGLVRLDILKMVGEKPRTISELSEALSLNYKTIEYHIRVLIKSGLLVEAGKKYKNQYCLSNVMNINKEVIEEFTKKMRKTK